jgi:hypothetical protein
MLGCIFASFALARLRAVVLPVWESGDTTFREDGWRNCRNNKTVCWQSSIWIRCPLSTSITPRASGCLVQEDITASAPLQKVCTKLQLSPQLAQPPESHPPTDCFPMYPSNGSETMYAMQSLSFLRPQSCAGSEDINDNAFWDAQMLTGVV